MIDGYFLTQYRRHWVASTSCNCDVNGADRKCDIGWALFKVAHPKKELQ